MTDTATPGECWSIWLSDLQLPPIAACVQLQDRRDPAAPLLGVLDTSRPRSLCCTECALVWSNWVMPDRCGYCGANPVPADELTTVGRDMAWGAGGTLLCTARLCSLCILTLPGNMARVYLDELGELDWSTD